MDELSRFQMTLMRKGTCLSLIEAPNPVGHPECDSEDETLHCGLGLWICRSLDPAEQIMQPLIQLCA